MLSSIDFNDELAIPANEVGNVWSNRFLANKLVATESAVAQGEPEFRLGIGGVPAQPPRGSNDYSIWASHAGTIAPHPARRFAPRHLLPVLRGEGK